MAMTSQFADMTSSSIFFWPRFVSPVRFSYWSKFHVNIITGSWVVTIFNFLHRGLTRNTHVWVLPNIWRLGRVKDIKFGTKVSSEILLNAKECQGYIFYRFWVIKGKPIGKRWGAGKITRGLNLYIIKGILELFS